jgi:uncharacterized repeat protein (TIGR01451 family)/fimbrial isopeptide formation D2 family protein
VSFGSLQRRAVAAVAQFALLLIWLICNTASAHTITSKTTPTPNPVVGGVVTYVLNVSSAGQTSPSTGMTTIDYLPPGFAYRSTVGVQLINGATYSAATTPTPGSTLPQWGLFDNPSNSSSGGPASSYVITFEADVVNPICGQTIPNSADTLGGSQHAVLIPATNQAPAVVTGPPPALTVGKTTSTPVVLNTGAAGMQALYRLVVTNAGSLCAATGVNISDVLPAGFTYASTTSITYTGVPAAASRAGGADPTVGAGSLTWTGFTIPAASSVTIDFVANITAGTANGTYNNSASATTTQPGAAVTNFGPGAPVQLVPALLTKSFAPTLVQVGTASTLTFTLSKPAGSALTGMGFTDNLPTNLVVSGVPTSPQCGGTVTGSGGAITVAGASLAAAATSCTIAVAVTSTQTGSYTNNASNFTGVTPTALSVTSANANLVVSNSALTKSFLTPLVGAGGTSVLRFTMTTPAGGAPHAGMSFIDTLPVGVSVVPGFTVSQCGGGTLSSSGAQNITFTNGSLGAGPVSCDIDITVRGVSPGVYTNDTSNISGLGGGLTAFTASSPFTVRGTVLEKSFSPPSTGMGTASTLSFNITNSVGTPAQSGLGFIDTLPTNVTLAAVPTTPQCGGTVSGTVGGNTITFSGGSLGASVNSCTITASVVSAVAGSYTNSTSNISGASTGLDTSGVSATLEVGSASLTKAFSDSPVGAASTITLRFTLTNRSGNPAQSGITFTDTFPAGLVISNATTSFGAGCSGTLTDLSGGTIGAGDTGVKLVGGAMTLGTASCVISVTVTSPVAGTFINNNAGNISGASSGLVTSGINSTAIFSGPVLDVTKTTSSPSIYIVGAGNGLATYELTVRNSGNATASTVVINDALPAGFTYASTLGVTLAGGATRPSTTNPTAGATAPSWNTFTLPGGSAVTITFTATVANATANGTYQNSASATSTTGGTNVTNYAGASSTNEDVTVARLADLVIAKAQTTANPVLQGQTGVQYTLTVSNAGGAAITAGNTVTVVDAPTANLTITAMSGPGWTCTVASATCTRTDALAAGAAYSPITVTGTVAASAVASFVNSSTVAVAGQTESDTNNNVGNAPATLVNPVPDIAVSKSHTGSFSQGQVGAQYTLVASSTATSGAISSGPITVTDTLPTGMTATAISGGASWSCVLGTLTCTYSGTYPVTAGTVLPAITLTVNVASNAALSLTNTATVSTLTGETVVTNNTANDITTIIAVGVPVSGTVYADVNHNTALDGAETGTGLTHYIKLVPSVSGVCTGPATAVATVAPATGAYSFATVLAGNYCLVSDDNNTLSDVTPNVTTGWLRTEIPTGSRAITVGLAALTQQNFGLYNGSVLTGRVFTDSGIGAGTPNDGVQNGTEVGQAGATVKVTDATGTTTFDTTLSDGAGNYTLWIPAAAGNNPLRVIETNVSGQISTGGQPGTTAGSYVRSTDTTTFTNVVGSSYSGVNFADVPANAFTTDGVQTGAAGTALFYSHSYTAGSGGSASFTTAAVAAPAIAGWSEILYRDTNCNGVLDAAEAASVLSAAISVTAGEVVCLIHKELIPAGAAMGAQNQVTLTALFTYTNASPALNNTQTRVDTTTVGTAASTSLTLVKSVNKTTALPGEVLIYSVVYTNNSSAPLSNLKINDATPSFTTYASATCVTPLPANLSACAVSTQPTVGTAGAIEWTLTGSLAPGSSGTVRFTVTVNP